MEFSRNYLVHYYEIDKTKRLTLPGLIHYFQDMAILHSENVGYTLDYYERNNQGFMILKWDINIYRMPGFNESIKIVTRPYSFKKFLANREFKVYDNSGALIAEANTGWVFADTNTRRPLRVPQEIHTAFGVELDAEKYYINLEDLSPVSEGMYNDNVKVREQDIDTNNHVNNVRYIEWALLSLPEEFRMNNSAANIKVNYKKELQLGDEADIAADISDSGDEIISKHTLYCSGKEVCSIQIKWTRESNSQ